MYNADTLPVPSAQKLHKGSRGKPFKSSVPLKSNHGLTDYKGSGTLRRTGAVSFIHTAPPAIFPPQKPDGHARYHGRTAFRPFGTSGRVSRSIQVGALGQRHTPTRRCVRRRKARRPRDVLLEWDPKPREYGEPRKCSRGRSEMEGREHWARPSPVS